LSEEPDRAGAGTVRQTATSTDEDWDDHEYPHHWQHGLRRFRPDPRRASDAIIHLAALSNDPIGDAYEGLTAEINHHASVRPAGEAKQAGVKRFVFASNCSVYGFAEGAAETAAVASPI